MTMNQYTNPIIYGEVLFDCFPDGNQVLGGAPFNVAWHCQAFGLSPLLISRIGDDKLGKQILQAMQDWGMNRTAVQLDNKHATGVVDIQFNHGEPSYTIVENSAWDFIEYKAIPKLQPSGFLYHGSLALRNKDSLNTLNQIKSNTEHHLLIDINLRKPWWNINTIQQLIMNSNIIKLNEHELSQIIPGIDTTPSQMEYLMQKYSINTLIVTRGEQGTLVKIADNPLLSKKPDTQTNVIDTVGAGDALSSVFLLGQYKNWDIETTLERAQAFASAIVGIQGATTNDRSFYESFINAWGL